MGCRAATDTCMSMTAFAARPGIAVEPLWSTRNASVPSARRSRTASASNADGQTGSYGTSSRKCPRSHQMGTNDPVVELDSEARSVGYLNRPVLEPLGRSHDVVPPLGLAPLELEQFE